jgi:alpha-galactosidase
MAIVKAAQASMETISEFRGNVRAIPTDVFWDKAADAVFPTWRDNPKEWEQVGSDRPYHYLGSALTFTRIGGAMAKAMLELQK